MSKAILLILIMFSAAACSNKAIYDNIRLNQRNDCLKEPPSVYLECVEGTDKPYKEYERERKELLDKASKT